MLQIDHAKLDGFDAENISGGKTEMKQFMDRSKLVSMINEKLDDTIRVFAMKMVTKKFDIKINVRSRVYEYILPFRVLYPMDPKLGDVPHNPEMTTERNDEIFKKFTKLVKKFEGTHNFHNYTLSAKVGDKSTTRYIISMLTERIPHEVVKKSLDGKDPQNEY